MPSRTTSSTAAAHASAGRVAVFGDLSGHLGPFRDALEDLGADLDRAELPEGLSIVQLGDLVHKGPDSDEIVALVDAMLARHPGRWLQLVGNHEAHHLAGGDRFWAACACSAETEDTLRRWVSDGAAHLAVAVDDEAHGPLLVTHAGLTRSLWVGLGRLPAPATAAALNELLVRDPYVALEPGLMLGHGPPNTVAGVAWAHAGAEVYASWVGVPPPPFGQVHGHTSVFWWGRRLWERGTPAAVRSSGRPNPITRHLTFALEGRPYFSIDPGFSRHDPARTLAPLVLSASVSDPSA